jgi:hypothetical protein
MARRATPSENRGSFNLNLTQEERPMSETNTVESIRGGTGFARPDSPVRRPSIARLSSRATGRGTLGCIRP